ncbi:MAG: cytochrome c3 family protein [Actinomycetota bacterium]
MKAGAKYLANIMKVEPEGMTLRFAFAYLALAAAMALAMVLFLSHPVYGYSPHGPFSSDTDKCTSCHRLHLANTEKLLPVSSTTGLCVSCHSKGQGADTAVMEGVYIEGLGPAAAHTWGASGALLLGGGFQYIDNTQAVTGSHQIGATGTPYGGNGAVYTLGCQDCHTPHYNNNYRLLRQRPGGAASDLAVAYNGPWTDATQTVQGGTYKAYTIADFSAGNLNSEQEYTRNYQAGLGEWCAQCHQKYMTRGWSSTDVYNAGDIYGSTARYRHAVNKVITGSTDEVNGASYNLYTDLPLEDVTGNGRTADDRLTCLTCHAAHGTAAKMEGSSVLGPDRGSLPTGADGLSLRTDGRKLCGECHNF